MTSSLPFRLHLWAILAALLALVWGVAFYEIDRDRHATLSDAETSATLKAQLYAESTRATIKRLNELLLHLRANWTGDWKRFAEIVQERQAHVDDIAFQIAVIDAEGLLAFSNLAPAAVRTDLSDREHFRVHKERDSANDMLFISRPILGRVSKKWSIQFTRPIWRDKEFVGVIVASISPEMLSAFHPALNLSEQGASSIARDSGEVMARFPDNGELVGKLLTWPFSDPAAPQSGHYQRVAQLDGIERIFGYHKLPEYGMVFFASESLKYLLAPHLEHRRTVILYAGAVSILLLVLMAMLYRTQLARERVVSLLDESEQQQQLLSKALEQSNASVMITDDQGRIAFVNVAFEEVTGFSRSEVIGQNPRLLKSGLTTPETYRELWATIASGVTWRGELQNRRKNGELYWEALTISPVVDEAGRVTHYIAVKEDVTARKQQEMDLRQAKEDAEAASIAKSQFLATMSHEIRTPMNGILGMAQLLLDHGVTDAERGEYARTILNSGNTLQTLLNDILDLSKVEAGKLVLMRAVFDPEQMLEEIANLFGDPARRKGLSIGSSWSGPAGRYWSDPLRLRQMLANLVSNAIKFTAHGSICIEAGEVFREEGKARLRFTVTDTGIGIPADKQTLLFQPFSQVDASSKRRFSGTGLGLSIVRNLAELMQGETGVCSEEGKGAQFWFEIAVDLAEPDVEARSQEREERSGPAASAIALPIMLVEDNATNQLVIKTMLDKHGYRVDCFENGRLALDALMGGERPALVLMDCQMPVMDGFETTQAIRQWEKEHSLPPLAVVALTAGAYEQDREHCLAVGMDDFLAKPVDLNRLLEMVARWANPGRS